MAPIAIFNFKFLILYFFLAEVILMYISSHCLLAHNEAKQNVMVSMYNRMVALLPEDHRTRTDSSPQLITPDNQLSETSCKYIHVHTDGPV